MLYGLSGTTLYIVDHRLLVGNECLEYTNVIERYLSLLSQVKTTIFWSITILLPCLFIILFKHPLSHNLRLILYQDTKDAANSWKYFHWYIFKFYIYYGVFQYVCNRVSGVVTNLIFKSPYYPTAAAVNVLSSWHFTLL